jgi:hypothetical protein
VAGEVDSGQLAITIAEPVGGLPGQADRPAVRRVEDDVGREEAAGVDGDLPG